MDVPSVNGTNRTCPHLSRSEDRTIFILKLVMLCMACMIGIVAISVLCYFKSYKRFVFRLILYLMIANLLETVVQVSDIIPIDHDQVLVRNGWGEICKAFGFFHQITLWISNFVVIWHILYICHLITKPRHELRLLRSKMTIREAIGICLCLFIPFVFNWIPFLKDGYGVAGHWCWFEIAKDACDTNNRQGIAFMFAMYYAPLLLIIFITSVLSFAVVIAWCSRSEPIRDMAIVIVYPIMFDVTCSIMAANRIEAARRIDKDMKPYFPLWIAHVVAEPTRLFLPALCFLFQLMHRGTRKMVTSLRLDPLPEESNLLN